MALSLKTSEEVYTVETSIGDYSNALRGYEFEVGEGLLGYSVATKQPQIYKNIKNDARVLAFQKIDMDVISLFCFPILRDQHVIGLLFGGSTKREIKETVLR